MTVFDKLFLGLALAKGRHFFHRSVVLAKVDSLFKVCRPKSDGLAIDDQVQQLFRKLEILFDLLLSLQKREESLKL